jgi:hypothetical protein
MVTTQIIITLGQGARKYLKASHLPASCHVVLKMEQDWKNPPHRLSK